MGKTGLLGAFEEIVLLALVRGGDEAYGVSVRRDIEERSGRSVAMGAVYATLDRLEEKGYAVSRVGDASESRRGRPRRYYIILPEGLKALTQCREVRGNMWEGIELPSPSGQAAKTK